MDTQTNIQFEPMPEQNNKIFTFNYEGTPISFNRGDAVMVNATEMAKPFGKRPAKWLELPSTKEFLSTLSDVRFSDFTFVHTAKGNSQQFVQGTWMHEDVAMEFARWLSPKFAIWCNDRIKELLQNGVVTAGNDDQTILNAITILQGRIQQNQRIIQQQTLLIEQKDKEIEEFKSKYSDLISQLKVKDDEIKILKDADEFGKNYIEADGTMTFDVACQYIGFGSHLKMRRWLESGDGHPKVVRILRYVNGKPEYGTYSPFTEKGWFKLKPNVIMVKGEPKQAPGTLRITTLGVAGVKIMYERWKKRIQKENE